MNDPAGSDAVGADKDPLMHTRAEEIDSNERRLIRRFSTLVLFLAKQHGESFQTGMGAGSYRIPDDTTQQHDR